MLTTVDMADDDKLPEITAEMLAAVTGGASGTSDNITAMLTTLMSSIKGLASSKSNDGGFGQMMPMMMMMMMHRQSQPAPVVAAPEPPPGDGWIKVA